MCNKPFDDYNCLSNKLKKKKATKTETDTLSLQETAV